MMKRQPILESGVRVMLQRVRGYAEQVGAALYGPMVCMGAIGLVLWGPSAAVAHVKWFSPGVGEAIEPLSWGQLLTPTFWLMVGLSLVVTVALSLLDGPIHRQSWYQKFRDYLSERKVYGEAALRITLGVTLLLCWQAGVLLAPELSHSWAWAEWLQFVAALCLLDRRLLPISGALVLVLYALSVGQYGFFHMLDYLALVGVAYYFVAGALPENLQRAARPVLFATTGFSLMWLGLEKLIYPQWSLALLEQNPVLALGLAPTFFLAGAAFIEFSVGYLVALGVLVRPLAAVVTVLFFLTTMIFGKDEVVGHLMLHGVLIAFLLEGTSDSYKPPFRLHTAPWLRSAFVAVNFCILLFGLTGTYMQMAQRLGAPEVQRADFHARTYETEADIAIEVHVMKATAQEVQLHFMLHGVALSAQGTGRSHRDGEGHVHILVDDRFEAMVFGPTYTIKDLTGGKHTITAQLSTNDHRIYVKDGQTVQHEVEVVIASEGASVDAKPLKLDFSDDDLVYFEAVASKPLSTPIAKLGYRLFNETALSVNNEISCNSCHAIDGYGVDSSRTSTGFDGSLGGRNAPTVYYSKYYVSQFWDGRAADLKAQALGPVLNPIEMGMPNIDAALERLRDKPSYRAEFEQAFRDDAEPINAQNVAAAIARFEEHLVTPGPFDAFLQGDSHALSRQQKAGLRRFIDLGCVACHNGPALGGGSHQRLGLVNPYPQQQDLGRYEVTQKESDKMVFKVPSLRNIAETAPYFHDGSKERLEDAIEAMGYHQLGKRLNEREVRDLAAFLRSLTGPLPKFAMQAPAH